MFLLMWKLANKVWDYESLRCVLWAGTEPNRHARTSPSVDDCLFLSHIHTQCSCFNNYMAIDLKNLHSFSAMSRLTHHACAFTSWIDDTLKPNKTMNQTLRHRNGRNHRTPRIKSLATEISPLIHLWWTQLAHLISYPVLLCECLNHYGPKYFLIVSEIYGCLSFNSDWRRSENLRHNCIHFSDLLSLWLRRLSRRHLSQLILTISINSSDL